MSAFFGKLPHPSVQGFGVGTVRILFAQFDFFLPGAGCLLPRFYFLGLAFAYDFYLVGLISPQGYFIAYYFIFYGVPQRGVQHYLDFFPFDESHFCYSLAERSVSAYFDYNSSFSGFKIRQFHLSTASKSRQKYHSFTIMAIPTFRYSQNPSGKKKEAGESLRGLPVKNRYDSLKKQFVILSSLPSSGRLRILLL